MDYIFLSHTLLFQGAKPEEVEAMLQSLDVRQQHYDRGRIIYHAGDTVDCLGVVISGCVQIENVDWWGNRSVLGSLGPGEVFAETYASLPEEPLKVSVVASEETEVLFLNVPQILRGCSGSHEFHPLLLRNLFCAAAQKTSAFLRGYSIPPRNPSGEGCSLFFPARRHIMEAINSKSPITGSSWQIISMWTAAPFPMS